VFLVLVLGLVIVGSEDYYEDFDEQRGAILQGGEHYPIIVTGSIAQNGTAACTTAWFPYAYATSMTGTIVRSGRTSTDSAEFYGWFSARYYAVAITLDSLRGDTLQISEARVETAHDTTGRPFWNGDSSNFFMNTDGWINDQYGVWKFEPLLFTSDMTQYYTYPMRSFMGGYMRLIFDSTVDDSSTIGFIVQLNY